MIKKILMTIQALLKAFWNATVKMCWGIAGIYMLAGLIQGMSIDASAITDLLGMSIIAIKYWLIFWVAFFGRDLYLELRAEVLE